MTLVFTAATFAQATIYNSVNSPLAPNYPSLGFQATSTSELGDYIHLGGSNRSLGTVTFTMSSWALQASPGNVSYCSANPGACTAEGFFHPFKVTIYNAPSSPTPGVRQAGSVVASFTQTKFVPWRPVSHPASGYAFDLSFDMSGLGVTLPNDIIVAIGFNTQSYGTTPIGVDGPFNSLNVALSGTVSPIGSDDVSDILFWNTSHGPFYSDGGAAGVGTLREDIGWSAYAPLPIRITTMGNSLIVRPSAQLDWQVYTTTGGTVGFTADGGSPAPGGALNLVTIADNNSRARYFRNVNVPLSDIYQLGYSSRTVSSPIAEAAPSYSIGVYLDGTAATFTNFVFEPYWSNGIADGTPVIPNQWQEWDVFSSSYLWASNNVNAGGSCQTTNGAGGPPFYSLAAIKSACPNAVVVSHAVYMGSYNPNWNSNVDLVRFNGTVWNFETDPTVILVDDDGSATEASCDAAGAAQSTIQGGINTAAPGQIVKVCPGTYAEDISVNKANLILQGSGAGSTTISGPIGGGVDTVSIVAPGVTIDGFTITRQGNALPTWEGALNNQGINVAASANAVIQNNVITGNRNAIYVGQSSNNVIIRRNTVDFNRTGIHLVDNNGGLITENFVRNNWTAGILYRTEGGTPPTALTVVGNHIAGNWYSEIEFREPATGGKLNMAGNYLGTTNPTRVTTPAGEPGYAAQIPVIYGGSAVPPPSHPTLTGAQSARVDYSPFLYSGTDADPVTPGFQSAFNSVGVNTDSTQAMGSADNLQEGLGMTASGGNLYVGSGSYNGGYTPSSKAIALNPGLSPGQVSINGSMALDANDALNIEITGTSPSLFDRIDVTGTVSLGGATLNLASAFAPSVGNSFTIISNDGSDAVVGTFSNGSSISIGSTVYTINYAGGDGNDVVLSVASIGACAAVSVSSGITTLTGVTLDVPIQVTDMTGKGAFGYDTVMTYNPAVLQYIGIEQVGTISSGLSIIPFNNAGTLSISAFSTGSSPLAGAGTLLKVRFNVIGAISSSSNVVFNNFTFNEGNPCSTTSNGSVQVISGTLAGAVTYVNGTPTQPGVPNVTMSAAGSPNVSGSTNASGNYSLGGFGPGGYTVTPSKAALPLGSFNSAIGNADTTRIAQHVVGLVSLNATQIIAGDVSNNGTLSNLDATYISQWKVGIANAGSTGSWIFQTPSKGYANLNASISGENYNAILKGDVTGNWNPLELPSLTLARNPKEVSKDAVRIEAVSVKAGAGNEISIPIRVSDLSGKGVTGYEFEVQYDPEVLEPADLSTNAEATLSAEMNTISNSPEPGRLIVFVYGMQPMSGQGDLINLRFRAIGEPGSETELKLVNWILNEGEIESFAIDGQVRVVESELATVKGMLLSSKGRPVANGFITAVDSQGRTVSVSTNSFGKFTLVGLRIGETYLISSRSRSGTSTPVSVAITDTVVEVNLQLQ